MDALKSAKWLAISTLLYVLVLHASTIYLFTRGFLLTRLSLTNIASCSTCTLPPTHSRAVLLIIDALRFDFLSPNPANFPSPYYHHILDLPSRITEQDPTYSFLFNTFADPPTTTLQRIKGITTGSLPTFVDMGSNFGGSEIAEDSLVLQMTKAGRKIAFMGDDTWTTVYPTLMSPNMSFPFDSFNVEDLHSVDEGVINNLFPLLKEGAASSWDLLVGHFLGVDHVGHRLGPAHPTMTAKLNQMNEVLARVVESLDDETLLIVMGDHGMDRKGDHGGDGEHETSAATWIYSKAKPLSSKHFVPPRILVPNITFPGAPVSHRSIQQIDLVPTLSLLLGLPIPFNNLGTIIPELFGRENGSLLEQALRLNAAQVKNYLDAYRASPSGGELDSVWNEVERSWASTLESTGDQSSLAFHAFTRLALASCRSLWAQFNMVLMYTGLFGLALSSAAIWALYTSLGRGPEYWHANGWKVLTSACIASLAGSILGWVSWLVAPGTANAFGTIEVILAGFSLTSSIAILLCIRPKPFLPQWPSHFPITLVLHALAFLSNSFTFWEDRILTYLLLTSLTPFVLCAFTPQANPRLRNRILFFSALFAACVKLSGISTVCREEQHPYCHVTFYASSSLPSPPTLVLLLTIPTSLVLPSIVRSILAISRSDQGVAPFFLKWGLRAIMFAGSACWIFEWLESNDTIGQRWAGTFRIARTQIARSAMGTALIGGSILWWYSPLCLEFQQSVGQGAKKQVQVIGFANAYGSSLLLFTLIPFSLLFVATQLTGQVTVALTLIAFLAFLEVIDSARDVRMSGKVTLQDASTIEYGSRASSPSFAEIAPVALLALHTFYATGHQSTMSSIQWKAAFLLTPTLRYPVSPLLVALNTFGPQLVFATMALLPAVWNVAPVNLVSTPPASNDVTSSSTSGSPHTSIDSQVLASSLQAALGMSLYFSLLLLSSAASSAWLRRHLMVWKVFAPRFIFAGIEMLVVDLGILLGMCLGVGRVVQEVHRTFGGLT